MSCPRSFRIISSSPIWVASSAFLRVFRVRCRGHAKVLQTLLSVFKETKLCFHKFPLFHFLSFYFGFFPLALPPCFACINHSCSFHFQCFTFPNFMAFFYWSAFFVKASSFFLFFSFFLFSVLCFFFFFIFFTKTPEWLDSLSSSPIGHSKEH